MLCKVAAKCVAKISVHYFSSETIKAPSNVIHYRNALVLNNNLIQQSYDYCNKSYGLKSLVVYSKDVCKTQCSALQSSTSFWIYRNIILMLFCLLGRSLTYISIKGLHNCIS